MRLFPSNLPHRVHPDVGGLSLFEGIRSTRAPHLCAPLMKPEKLQIFYDKIMKLYQNCRIKEYENHRLLFSILTYNYTIKNHDKVF